MDWLVFFGILIGVPLALAAFVGWIVLSLVIGEKVEDKFYFPAPLATLLIGLFPLLLALAIYYGMEAA